MIHKSSRQPDDRALIEYGDRTIRIDGKGLAHVYNERGERIAREVDAQSVMFRGEVARAWE
jgi:hypothetical protein